MDQYCTLRSLHIHNTYAHLYIPSKFLIHTDAVFVKVKQAPLYLRYSAPHGSSRTTEYYQTYITQKQTMRDKGIFFRITMTLHLDGPIILPFLFLLSLICRLELPNLGRTLMKLYHAARKNQKFTSCSFLYTKKISWSPQPRKQKRRSLSPKSQLQQTAKKQ